MFISTERHGRSYGDHRLIGGDESFFKKTPLEKALDLAWSDGCPVGVTLTRPVEENGRGAEVMAKRYGEVNFWAGYLRYHVFQEAKRGDLIRQLYGHTERSKSEPIGIHDNNWTPGALNKKELVSPELYALPRIISTFINSPKESQSIEEKQKRMTVVLEGLEYLAEHSLNIQEFTVRLVGGLVHEGGDTNALLKALLSNGKLNEDNCKSQFSTLTNYMYRYAPAVYRSYKDLSTEKRKELGIADIR